MRIHQIRRIAEHFRKSAEEAATLYFRELMQRAAAELDALAASLEASPQKD